MIAAACNGALLLAVIFGPIALYERDTIRAWFRDVIR